MICVDSFRCLCEPWAIRHHREESRLVGACFTQRQMLFPPVTAHHSSPFPSATSSARQALTTRSVFMGLLARPYCARGQQMASLYYSACSATCTRIAAMSNGVRDALCESTRAAREPIDEQLARAHYKLIDLLRRAKLARVRPPCGHYFVGASYARKIADSSHNHLSVFPPEMACTPSAENDPDGAKDLGMRQVPSTVWRPPSLQP